MPRDSANAARYVSLAQDFLVDRFLKSRSEEKIEENLLGCMLTGSTVYESIGNHRDIDLILFIPKSADEEFDVPHVLSSEYRGEKIEMNVMTDERLERAAKRKDYLDTFSNGRVVWAESERVEKLINEAGRVTEKDKRAILWTNYCQFMIDGSAQKRDLGPVSDDILTEKRVRLFTESMLADADVFVREKWFGEILSDIDDEAYELAKRKDIDGIGERFRELLLENGFSAEELDDWKRSNSELLLFRVH